MRTYQQTCLDCQYNRPLAYREAPVLSYNYVAYKEGKVYHAATQEAAWKISKNIEKIVNPESKKVHDAYWKKIQETEARIFDVWMTKFKEEYINDTFTEAMFDVIYSKAYDDSHSDGYDAVYYTFDALYDLVQNVLSAKGQ